MSYIFSYDKTKTLCGCLGYGKLEGKRPLRKHRVRCGIEIKMNLKKYDGIGKSGFVWHMTLTSREGVIIRVMELCAL